MIKKSKTHSKSVKLKPKANKKYLSKLNKIYAERSIHIGSIESFKKRYKLE
jgi:hypothetical protein